MDEKRVCKICKIEKELSKFEQYNYFKGSDKIKQRRRTCKFCRAKYRNKLYADNEIVRQKRKIINQKDYLKHRNAQLKKKYGITLEEYNEKCNEQGNKCAICGEPNTSHRGRQLVVDHNHETGQIRGLLCNKCNTALGLLHENTNKIESMLSYIKHYSNVCEKPPL